VIGWEEAEHKSAKLFLEDWEAVVKAQNQATLDGSPVAQAIIKFMEDKDEYSGKSSELHKELEVVAEAPGVSLTRDKAWPKSARWLWRRIKEVLPLLVAVGIEASRTEDKSGSWITLRKLPRNDATDATEGEPGIDKPKMGGNKAGDDVTSNAIASESNATGGNNGESNATRKVDSYAGSGNGGNSGIRYGDSSDRLTADEVQEVRRLVREGVSAERARKEVLGQKGQE
jgi:hypothetical protein